MNVIFAVILFILLAGVELGYGQLRDCLNPIDVHALSNCVGSDGANGKPLGAWTGPCYETPTCKIPCCCGIISGRDSLFRIAYKAAIDLQNGTFNGYLNGVLIGDLSGSYEQPALTVDIPVGRVLVPPLLAGYKRTLNDQTQIPQKYGGHYVLDVPYRFVTAALTTTDLVKAVFVAEILTENRKHALCWGLRATVVNSDLVESLDKTVNKVKSNPVAALLNPASTLEAPLAGLIGRKNENPFKYPKLCPDEPNRKCPKSFPIEPKRPKTSPHQPTCNCH